jgi:hypothetical protein
VRQRKREEKVTLCCLTYCTYNLLAYACTAQVAAKFGVDLWNWKSSDGRGLLPALRWLLPYYAKERAWEQKQIKPFDFTNAALLLNLAWQRTGEEAFARLCDQVEVQPWQRITFSKASLAVRKG